MMTLFSINVNTLVSVTSKQFTQRPNMIFDSCFNGRSDSDRPVDAAEVVPSEVQTERGPQVLPLLAERISQSGKPANLHPHREVLPLDVGCADSSLIKLSLGQSFALMTAHERRHLWQAAQVREAAGFPA